MKKKLCSPCIATSLLNNIGWVDENEFNPKYSGKYICKIRWFSSNYYVHNLLHFDKEKGWDVTDSCEHILWQKIPHTYYGD